MSTEPRACVLSDDIVSFNIERNTICVPLNCLTMAGGARNGTCSTFWIKSHTLGTGEVLLFLLLPCAVSSKQNVFLVFIDVEPV